jgi:hypothetical protein
MYRENRLNGGRVISAWAAKETKTTGQTTRLRWVIVVGRLLITISGMLLASGMTAHAGLHEPCRLDREEINTQSPFGPFRERSTQRLTWYRWQPYLTSELSFRHVIYKDFAGVASKAHQLYHASFSGRPLTTPLEFSAGRIWAGNHQLRPIDGATWWYPWGERLKTTLTVGRSARVDLNGQGEQPSFFEGRFDYRFNQETTLTFQRNQEFKEGFSSGQIGYKIDNLRFLGEYRNTGATGTARLGLQYYDGHRCDLTGDYRLNQHDDGDSGVMRNILAIEMGEFYLETGVGGTFFLEEPRVKNDTHYYEGSVTWGDPRTRKDILQIGYMLEKAPASSARTLSGHAERRVSRKTTLGLGVSSTVFEESGASIQNLEGSLHRRVDWGFYEIRLGMINSASQGNLQKDVGLRAGYEF